MNKRLNLIVIVVFMLFSLSLSANGREFGAEVSTSSEYTPGQINVLNFNVNITGGSYMAADYVELEFPEGISPANATDMGSESGNISGQKITWGSQTGWYGSGAGTISGNNSVEVTVEISDIVSGNQTIEWEILGDSPYDVELVSGDCYVNQLAVSPIIALDTDHIAFPPTVIGESNTAILTVSNIGINSLTIDSITGNDDVFEISDYSTSIEEGESLEIEVTFTPTEFALSSSSIIISSNGGLDKEVDINGIGINEVTNVESFEAIFEPSGWTDPGNVWAQSSSHPFDGEKSALCGGNVNDYLVTPKLHIVDGDKVIYHSSNGYDNPGGIILGISSDASNWTELNTTSFTDIYQTIEVDLSSFVGDYYLGFKREGDRYTHLDQVIFPAISTEGQVPSAVTLVQPQDAALNVTKNIELAWNSDLYAQGYKLSIGTDTEGTNLLNEEDLGLVTSYEIELDWSTQYFWSIRPYSSYGEAEDVAVWSFTTEANPVAEPPYIQDFTEFLPAFWTKARGFLTEDSTLESSTSGWIADGYLNDGDEGSARLNIWGTGVRYWLITPTIDLASGSEYELTFDTGLTSYNGTTASSLSEDDVFAVVISTDNGATWSNANILREWRSTDTISNTGETVTISLADYSEQVKIAFYGESTLSNNDYNVYVDNFKVLPAVETPVISLSVEEIEFNDTIVDSTRTVDNITIGNSGSGTLRITSIDLSDTDNFSLIDSNDYPVEMMTNSIELAVNFNPTSAGQHSANVTISTNVGDYTIDVNGLAYVPLAGDIIETAIDVVLDDEGNFLYTASNSAMYNDYDLPANDGKDVVFKLVFDNDAEASISLLGSDYDTKLGVYAEGVLPASDNYLFYNDNFDTRIPQSSLEDLTFEAGTYYIVVDSYAGAEGNYSLQINASVQTVEANVTLSADVIDFTDMNVGNSTDTKNLVISNNGETSFVINSISLDSDDFNYTLNGQLPIEISENIFNVGLAFVPQTAEQKEVQLTINTNAGDYQVTLQGNALDIATYYESFEHENYPPAGWLSIDNDGDEHSWNSWSGSYARTGDKFTKSNSGSMFGDDYDPQNWLVTPKVNVREADSLIYYVRPMNPEIYGDSYDIKVSTSGTNVSDFTTTIASEQVGPEIWERKVVDLSDFVGQDIYIAFYHYNDDSVDTYAFGIDDIFLPPLVYDQVPSVTSLIYPEDDQEYVYHTTALYWNEAANANGYKINVGTDNPPTNILNNVEVGSVTSKVLTNLEPETQYYWQVIPTNSIGDASNAPIWNFTTSSFSNLDVPVTDNFNDYNSMPFFPLGWSEFLGLYGTENDTRIINTYLGWGLDNFANQEADNDALTIEFYGDEVANWVVSPLVDLGSNEDIVNQVRFDLALTKSTTQEIANFGSDDKLMLMISTDNGASWTEDNILKVWNSNTPISNTGQSEVVDLDGYSGEVVFAFYAESTEESPNCKISIDNLFIGEQATNPVFNILPNNHRFDLTQTGNMSATKSFRIANVGIGTLEINSVELTGDGADQFVMIDSNTYPSEITTGQIDFNVIFRPTNSGLQEAFITVSDGRELHNIPISGYAYGTEGNTIDDPIQVEFTDNEYTAYGNSESFDNTYVLPYETAIDDANDVVYKLSFEDDMTVHVALNEVSWDTKVAVYSASETPGPDNALYYNDDSEEMRLLRNDNRNPQRGYNSIITFMDLPAGDYFLIVDGSNKTSWFEPYGEYRIDIAAYHFVPATNLTAVVENSNVALNWDAPQADDGSIVGYAVFRDGHGLTPALVTNTSYIDDTVVAGFEYSYQIVAYYNEPAGYSHPTASATVSFGELSSQVFSDDFEDYDDFAIEFDPWTLHNVDGANNYAIQDFEWANMAAPYAYMIFNPYNVNPSITIPEFQAHSATKFVAHFASEGVTNNDWMITPQIQLGSQSSIDFWAKSFTKLYGSDYIKVLVSTTGTEPEDFTALTEIPTDGEEVPTSWKHYIYSLADYEGQTVYIAIQTVSEEGFLLMIDQVTVRSNQGSVDNEDNNVDMFTESLNNNYPNPFNPETTINFSMKERGKVRIDIFNVKGQKVNTLINDTVDAGSHNVVWNGKDSQGRRVASGVFFYKMKTKNISQVKKMILMK